MERCSCANEVSDSQSKGTEIVREKFEIKTRFVQYTVVPIYLLGKIVDRIV